jgi:DNA invertase Pin-like site-specific DNA recombinase
VKNATTKAVRCAIYTRVSTDHGLEQDFNSLDAQHDAAQAYIRSQAHAGWTLIRARYDDGGYSGGSTDRPALQRLLSDVKAGKIDVIVVYKVDRLTRSLADFAKLVELFDGHGVSFVSVTQQFNTTTSMGRLTLNVLLSFAQFEREVTSERIRDKIAASKRKGLWVGSRSAEGINRLVADLNRSRTELRPGTLLTREWDGHLQRVMVLADGFAWNGKTYRSLSKVAFAITGSRWNGPRFFGLRDTPSSEARP